MAKSDRATGRTLKDSRAGKKATKVSGRSAAKSVAAKRTTARAASSGRFVSKAGRIKKATATAVRSGESKLVRGRSPVGAVIEAMAYEASPGDWLPSMRAAFVSDVAGGMRSAAELLDVDPAQTSRWASGKSKPSAVQARVLLDMDHVMGHALLVWPTEALVRDWLNTPNAHLDGATPAAWIRLHGSAEVVEVLRAEAAGAFA